MKTNTIIYQLTIEDIQLVASETLNRTLSLEEINLIKDKVGDNIDWFQAIEQTIVDYNLNKNKD